MRYYPTRIFTDEYLSGKEIVDIGGGDGKFAEDLFSKGYDIISTDIIVSWEALDLPFIAEDDFLNTTLPEDFFDIAFANASLFLPSGKQNWGRYVENLARILNKDGEVWAWTQVNREVAHFVNIHYGNLFRADDRHLKWGVVHLKKISSAESSPSPRITTLSC